MQKFIDKQNFINTLMKDLFKISDYKISDIDKLYSLFISNQFYDTKKDKQNFIKFTTNKYTNQKITAKEIATSYENMTDSKIHNKFAKIRDKIYAYFYKQVKDPKKVNITDDIHDYFDYIDSNLSNLFRYETEKIKAETPICEPATEINPHNIEGNAVAFEYNHIDGKITLQTYDEGFLNTQIDVTSEVVDLVVEKLFNELKCPKGDKLVLLRELDERDGLVKIIGEVVK